MFLPKYLALVSVLAVVASVALTATMARQPADRSPGALALRWASRIIGMVVIFIAACFVKSELTFMPPLLAVMPFFVSLSLMASIVAFTGGLVVDAAVGVGLAVVMVVISGVETVITKAHIADLVAKVAAEDQAMLQSMAAGQLERDLFFSVVPALFALAVGVAAVVAVRRRGVT